MKPNLKESERNKKMVCNILRGYTFKQVGFIYRITGQRVREITVKVFGKIAPRMNYNLKGMRKRKYHFISIIESNL